MAGSVKSGQIQVGIADRHGCAGDAAEILRAAMTVREVHAAVLESWDGKAADAANKAFARFDDELSRYENMVRRFAKSYNDSGDRDAG